MIFEHYYQKEYQSLIGKKYKNVLISYLEDSRLKLEVEIDMVVADSRLKELDTVQEDKLQVVVGDTLVVDKETSLGTQSVVVNNKLHALEEQGLHIVVLN